MPGENQVKLINCYFKQHRTVLLEKYRELSYFREEPPVDSNAFCILLISNMESIRSVSFS